MYGGHEILGATVEDVIDDAITHAIAEHGFKDGHIPPVTITVWRRYIHDVPDTGQERVT